MSAKVIKPTFKETVRYGRRSFIRRAAFAAGGLATIGHLAPNLIINPAYAGTVVIIDSSGDKRVSISNGSFARPFDVGTWSYIRVGIRANGEFSGALTSVYPNFFVGFCSGSSNQIFDASTTNAIGFRTTAETWAFVDDTVDYTGPSVASKTQPTKRVNTTWTEAAAPSTNNVILYRASQTTNLGMFMLGAQKGSPNWTTELFYHTNSAGNNNITRDDFLAQMVAVSPSYSGHTLAGTTIAFDEVAGTIDHIQIGWSRHEATVEISDLVVVKMAA